MGQVIFPSGYFSFLRICVKYVVLKHLFLFSYFSFIIFSNTKSAVITFGKSHFVAYFVCLDCLFGLVVVKCSKCILKKKHFQALFSQFLLYSITWYNFCVTLSHDKKHVNCSTHFQQCSNYLLSCSF